jgi:hypothetical protein
LEDFVILNHFLIKCLLVLLIFIGVNSGNAIELIELDPDFIGEQKANNTIYLSKQECKKYEIRINKRGLIVDSKGKLIDTRFLPNGTAMFVYSKNKKIYISQRRMPLMFDHSSLVAGEPVIVAGSINIRRGNIKVLADPSAMYVSKEKANLNAAIKKLRELGANLSKMRVFYHFNL